MASGRYVTLYLTRSRVGMERKERKFAAWATVLTPLPPLCLYLLLPLHHAMYSLVGHAWVVPGCGWKEKKEENLLTVISLMYPGKSTSTHNSLKVSSTA